MVKPELKPNYRIRDSDAKKYGVCCGLPRARHLAEMGEKLQTHKASRNTLQSAANRSVPWNKEWRQIYYVRSVNPGELAWPASI